MVLTSAPAAPASLCATPAVAWLIAVAITAPMPSPAMTSGGSTWPAYELSTSSRESHSAPIPPSSIPALTTSFGPKRGSRTLAPVVAVTMMAPLIGRNASPVRTGDSPRTCWR
ncbi:hypothetical protein GA0115246_113987 [Streptomyces sp. SolWspMP-sol7th]|nr:hypothetical protein GA0115246_113987 [Streptomyces sp. SolWspMP-sol7th]